MPSQEHTACNLVKNWNLILNETIDMVKQQNESFKELHRSGSISSGSLAKLLQPLPKPVPKPTERWARHYLKNFGWSLLSASPEQASLPYNHPDMELYRSQIAHMVQSGKVHKHLILNFDQIWRCAFNVKSKLLWKRRGQVGQRSKKRKVPKTLEKKRHCVRGARKSVTAPSFKGG